MFTVRTENELNIEMDVEQLAELLSMSYHRVFDDMNTVTYMAAILGRIKNYGGISIDDAIEVLEAWEEQNEELMSNNRASIRKEAEEMVGKP